jgi:protein-tyrosine phosphatase
VTPEHGRRRRWRTAQLELHHWTVPRQPPDVARVIPGLWIGSASADRHAGRLVRDGINCVVDLRAERERRGRWPQQVVDRHVPLQDHGSPSVEELRTAAGEVVDMLKQGYEVLVHCHAGLERAPTVACASLLLMGWPLTAAYQKVLQAHPGAAPTDGQMAALRAMADQLTNESGST